MKKTYHESKLRPEQTAVHHEIGERVRRMREERGLSMQAVAELGGPSIETLHKLESGIVEVDLETLQKLGSVFDVRPLELMATGNSDVEEISKLVCRMGPMQVARLRAQLEKLVLN